MLVYSCILPIFCGWDEEGNNWIWKFFRLKSKLPIIWENLYEHPVYFGWHYIQQAWRQFILRKLHKNSPESIHVPYVNFLATWWCKGGGHSSTFRAVVELVRIARVILRYARRVTIWRVFCAVFWLPVVYHTNSFFQHIFSIYEFFRGLFEGIDSKFYFDSGWPQAI